MPRDQFLLGIPLSSAMARTALLATFLISPAAFAQNNRSAVSVGGVDTNPCTVTSPCRSFTTAMGQTNAGGEIIALDSAGYGPFTINKAVAISGAPGIHAAITVTSGTGITINGDITADQVLLRNLVLIGAGGTTGIDVVNALATRVIGCLIRGFTANGIHGVLVTTGPEPEVTVDHSRIVDCVSGPPAYGVFIQGGPLGNVPVRGTFVNSSFENSGIGVHVDLNANAVIVNSTLSGNVAGAEVVATVGTDVPSRLMLENTIVASNGVGLYSNATGTNNFASLVMSQLVLAYNQTATLASGTGGEIRSFENNRFVSNGTDGGPFVTQSLQ